MPLRLTTCALLTLAAALGMHDAMALGFGRPQRAATLGQPLDFSVAVRLDSGEFLLPECLAAEVTVGDAVLPRSAVAAQLETAGGAPSIRVRTSLPIDEPIVAVTVIAGCDGKVSRRFTLFADPPGLTIGAPPLVATDPLPGVPAAAPELLPPVPSALPSALPSGAPPGLPEPAARAARAAPALPPAATPKRPARSAKSRPAAQTARARAAASPAPRLRLDEPRVSATAALAAASAALQEASVRAAEEAARSASVAAAAAQRVTALEQSLEALKREAQVSRETLARMNAALAAAEQRDRWTPLLWAALLLLLAAVAWLAHKLRAARSAASKAWWNAAPARVDAHPVPAVVPAVQALEPAPIVSAGAPEMALTRDDITVAIDRQPRTTAQAAASEAAAGPVLQRTVALPAALVVPEAHTRDVSIEELLDLEQQAEFFIVLGQDDAAIDLLVGHLRSTGGTSPLPYLKLLEIYRRRNDEAAYERTRDRFNQRFNAVAPAWATDLQAGRTLEDYPDVLASIERSWATPGDAMADLETLLFRTDGGQLFDLPAYREVLFLCAVARDLLEQADRHAPHIDLLLPLGDGADFSTTAARPYLSADPGDALDIDLVHEDRPTAPVDLDLTEPGPDRQVTSGFGFLEAGTSPKAG